MVNGVGTTFDTPMAAIDAAYDAGVTDEFIPASVFGDFDGIKDGDGLMCMNYRADRAREIMAAVGDPAFDRF